MENRTSNYPIISSYEYRGVTIKVNRENGWPVYTMFRNNTYSRSQILTSDGFRSLIGRFEPEYDYYAATIIKSPSLDQAVEAIDKVIKDEEYTARSDKTSNIYKSLMENARGDNINRDEIWAAACLQTGFVNTRKLSEA